MKFYEFEQNKSHGKYCVSKEDKISEFILIEAFDRLHANALAIEFTDIYFDGAELEIDCPCCGDRWRRARESDVVELTEEYKKRLKDRTYEKVDFICVLPYGKDIEIIEL